MSSNKKGFTIIELLVAMVILMFVMIGFLMGILQYTRFTLRAQYNDKAVEIATKASQHISTLPMNHPFFMSASYYQSWNQAPASPCTQQTGCYFENVNSDGDNIPDFYDPYNGDNQGNYNTPYSTADWLYVKPPSGGGCSVNIGMDCVYSYRGNTFYLGMTIAPMGPKPGVGSPPVAVGIVVWYFDPTDRDANNRPRYKQTRTLVMRSP